MRQAEAAANSTHLAAMSEKIKQDVSNGKVGSPKDMYDAHASAYKVAYGIPMPGESEAELLTRHTRAIAAANDYVKKAYGANAEVKRMAAGDALEVPAAPAAAGTGAGTAFKQGDVKQYQGANYTFDGTKWVRQ